MEQQRTFYGHQCFSDGHPDLRWRSQGGINTGRLWIEDDEVVIASVPFFGIALRMPTVRIPTGAIEKAWGIAWGVKLSTPSRPDLDGTVFKCNTRRGGRELKATFAKLVSFEEMTTSERVRGWFRRYGKRQANGFRWCRQTIRGLRARW